VTTGNRAQRRAKPQLMRKISQFDKSFEPHVIGTVTLAELRQIKTRTEVIEDAQKRQRLLDYEVQLLLKEAANFVTVVANAHDSPPGGQCTIDSESGEITLISIVPVEEPAIAQAVEVVEPAAVEE
jgi:hypothetical protein